MKFVGLCGHFKLSDGLDQTFQLWKPLLFHCVFSLGQRHFLSIKKHLFPDLTDSSNQTVF